MKQDESATRPKVSLEIDLLNNLKSRKRSEGSEKTLPMILQWEESFDIGSDTLTGVNDADYKPPFPLTAKLNKLTIKVDRPKLSP